MTADGDADKALPDLVLDIDDTDYEVIPTNDASIIDAYPSTSKCEKHSLDKETPSTSQSANKIVEKHHSDESKSFKTERDAKATPKRSQLPNARGISKVKPSTSQSAAKPCHQHTFLTDITEVRQMEHGLLKLLDDFHSGKLQAFGKGCTFEKMEQVREQQEKLARLHFELNAQQEIYGSQSEDGRRMARENLGKLIENLQQLSDSIEQLQVSSPGVQTDV